MYSFNCITGKANSVRSEDENRIYIQQPEKNPEFIIGRLPGKSWREHNPPKFKADQSFETIDSLRKSVLAVYKNGKDSTIEKLFFSLKSKYSDGKYQIEESIFNSHEGDWKTLTIAGKSFISRVYAIRKAEILIWVQFTSPDTVNFALYSSDAQRYINNFWFLYDQP